MKRVGNLFYKIIDMDNLRLAHEQARKGKLHYSAVKEIDKDPESYLKKIQESLINKTFKTSSYRIEEILDSGKFRTIYKLPYYPDRIVQHALINIIGPIFLKSFNRDTFQAIPGRGTSDAASRLKKAIRSDNYKFALKLDIRKYYESINTTILKQIISEKIKCKETLWLIYDIIESTSGLPIGNYTSQYFGNIYLYKFDWFVKQKLKLKYYRYCDDMIFLFKTKNEILTNILVVIDYLNTLHLLIKTPIITNIFRDGVDFVGFIFFNNFTLLRVKLLRGFRERLQTIKKNYLRLEKLKAISTIMCYKGWIQQASAKVFWRLNTNSKRLRRVFRFHSLSTDKLYGVV